MDVLLRNLDSIAIKKIDELAKQKRLSRQEYLKALIEKMARETEPTEKETQLELLINKNMNAMHSMSQSVQQMERLLAELTEE